MPTFRRLNDGTRYYGLTWQGWIGVLAAFGLLYGMVKLSPLPTKPTISLSVFALALLGAAGSALSQQALTPARFLSRIVAWRFSRRYYVSSPAGDTARGGVTVDAVPVALAPAPALPLWGEDDTLSTPPEAHA